MLKRPQQRREERKMGIRQWMKKKRQKIKTKKGMIRTKVCIFFILFHEFVGLEKVRVDCEVSSFET